MKTVVKVDEVVIKQVLAQFNVQWGDDDFEFILANLKLCYLHYRKQEITARIP